MASEASEAEDASPVPATSLYVSAVGLTLTNPMTIMAFGAVFASAGLVAAATPYAAVVATLGVALGSLCWWLALTGVVATVRRAISATALAWVSRVSGLVVAVFGVAAILSAL